MFYSRFRYVFDEWFRQSLLVRNFKEGLRRGRYRKSVLTTETGADTGADTTEVLEAAEVMTGKVTESRAKERTSKGPQLA